MKRETLVEVLTKRKTVTANDKLILPYSLSEVSELCRARARMWQTSFLWLCPPVPRVQLVPSYRAQASVHRPESLGCVLGIAQGYSSAPQSRRNGSSASHTGMTSLLRDVCSSPLHLKEVFTAHVNCHQLLLFIG